MCCAISQLTTVTQAEMRAATEAVMAAASLDHHGKVMFHLEGQVLENPSNPIKRTRSLHAGQGDNRLQVEAVSVDARASTATYFSIF